MKVPLVVAFPIVFFKFSDRGRHGGLLKLMKNDTFKYFLPLWPVFSRFWAGLGADHTLFYKNKESVLWLKLLVFFWGRRRQ